MATATAAATKQATPALATPSDWLRQEDVGLTLGGLTGRQVRALVRSGRIPAPSLVLGAKRWLWSRAAFSRWLQQATAGEAVPS